MICEADFMKSGSFFVGCNYWSSHAGTAMWSDWRPEVVKMDMEKLHKSGLQVIRVFPLWSDFQPVDILHGGKGRTIQYGIDDKPLPDNEAGNAGMSACMIERFDKFLKIAENYRIKVIVGLITGWMSGRMFIPPALKGRNILTDPVSIKWQVRFVKYFVKHFIDNKSIVAWDLGNECNAMGKTENSDFAWNWTASITHAIKSVDAERPVISGMHGLKIDNGNWNICDQAEITDILTTHPYPEFTPHCNYEPVNTIRPVLHSAAQTCYYSDIGGKPCFAEEIGTLGPMIACNEYAADFARGALFSLWAHDCKGFLWWCAFDQVNLTHAPYDWKAIERELGLITEEGWKKPVLEEIEKFKSFLGQLPFRKLPSRICEGTCILSSDQDNWGVAFSTFILAKQAGFDIEFQSGKQPVRESSLYLIPCISGQNVINRRRWIELLDRVSNGATLYISWNNGFISEFEKITGLKVLSRERCKNSSRVEIDNGSIRFSLDLSGDFKLKFKNVDAEVLGINEINEPVFTKTRYGRGMIYFLAFPMEMQLTETPGVFNVSEKQYWKLYKCFFSNLTVNRIIEKENSQIGVTEHPIDIQSRIAIINNHSPLKVQTTLKIKYGWFVENILRGNIKSAKSGQSVYTLEINKNNSCIIVLRKNN